MIRLLARSCAAVLFPNNLKYPIVFCRCRQLASYRLGSCRTENKKLQTFSRPGSSYRCHLRKRSFLRGPSPRRGNASGFWRTFEASGLGSHVARRAWTAAPRRRNTPPTSTRSFVSGRHKSYGDPRSRTGLQCGQVGAKDGAQRPGTKVYMLSLIHI